MKPGFFFILAALVLWGFADVSFARDFSGRKGVAVVHVHSKRINQEFSVGVFLRGNDVRFFAIDDFGGVPFGVQFDRNKLVVTQGDSGIVAGGRRVKAFLSLPVDRGGFLAVLNHEKPVDFVRLAEDDIETWRHVKRKHLKVIFDGFGACGRVPERFPLHLKMEHKKHFFEMTWQTCESIP